MYRIAKKVVAYLVTTSHLGLEFNKFTEEEWLLSVFTDSSFADNSDDKYQSTAGALFLLNGNLFHHKSKKMKWVATSSSEAEYLACFYAAREAMYFAYLVEEIYDKNVFPIQIMTDNMAVVNVVNKEAASVMTRHMATKFYALQDWISEGIIEVLHVSSKENLADTLTQDVGNYDAFKKEFRFVQEKEEKDVGQRKAGREMIEAEEVDGHLLTQSKKQKSS
mgnify:CR=1 FL=1